MGLVLWAASAAHAITMPGPDPGTACEADDSLILQSDLGSDLIDGCSGALVDKGIGLDEPDAAITGDAPSVDPPARYSLQLGWEPNPGEPIDLTPGGYLLPASDLIAMQTQISTAPEPKTMLLLGVALVALSLMGDKRRPH